MQEFRPLDLKKACEIQKARTLHTVKLRLKFLITDKHENGNGVVKENVKYEHLDTF